MKKLVNFAIVLSMLVCPLSFSFVHAQDTMVFTPIML